MLLTICMLAEPMAVRAEQKTESTETETNQETEALTENVETESVKSDVQPGERTATIMVVSITGNELTYYEVEDETEKETESEVTEQNETDADAESEETETSTDADKKTEAVEKDAQTDDAEPEDTEGTSAQKDSSKTPPDGMSQGDSSMTPPDGMPQGDSSMTPPDGMSQRDGTMTPPDGMSQNDSDSTSMPENIPSGDFKGGGRDKQQDTKTVYLPVPVVVHTDTDEKRTFSILEAGDRLQVTIVTDEDGNETITEIWMLNE